MPGREAGLEGRAEGGRTGRASLQQITYNTNNSTKLTNKMKKKLLHMLAAAAVLVPMSAYAADAPENLYIKGWTVNGTSWENIAQTAKSEDGKTFYFKATLKDGKTFKFFDGTTEIGPGGSAGGQDDKEIFCDNTYTMASGGAAYILNYNREDGAFSITVDYNGDSPRVRVTPGHEKYPEIEEWKEPDPIVPGEMPETLNLVGLVGSGDWQTPGNYVSCTAVDKEAGTITFTNAEITGAFAFCDLVGSDITADDCKGHDWFMGPQGGDTAAQQNGTHNVLYTESTYGYTVDAGVYNITVYFPEDARPYFTITRAGEIAKKYYFIGDMNDWYSSEFTETKYVVDNTDGIYVKVPYTVEETGVTDYTYQICQRGHEPEGWDQNYYRIDNQADFKYLDRDKAAWEFKFIGTLEGHDGDNWYEFSDFPAGALTGQFQIFDGTNWGGDVYSHAQPIKNDGGTNPHWNQYQIYAATAITRDQIASGTELLKGVYEGNVTDLNNEDRILVNGDEDGMIQHHNGQNFHMECNAVYDAHIYFQPGDDPKMIIQGDPVDFYIFYGMPPDESPNDRVRAIINQGKPNTNNYFLPGIWYGQYNDNNKSPLPNVPEDQEHMNLNGENLVKISLEGATVDGLLNVRDEDGNLLFHSYQTTETLLKNMVTQQLLPNNMSLEGYKEIWVQKIPNGFCNPAGRKFTMSFVESLNAADRRPVYTITANHMYFFSMDPAHIHVNAEAVEAIANVEVSYRIYGQDAYWNTVVIGTDHESEDVEVIYTRREVPQATANETGAKKEAGWVKLASKYDSCDSWACNHLYHAGSDVAQWRYSDKTADADGTPSAGHALADDDARRAVASRYSYKYVQFRFRYSPKDEPGALKFDPYEIYVPEAPRAVAENQAYNLGGHDYYINLADDPVYTGIEGIYDDFVGGDSSVEEGEPVYYNLQGVRVENPAHGLYIKVTGSTSEKVMF